MITHVVAGASRVREYAYAVCSGPMGEPTTVRVAAIQATPAILDADASVAKAVALLDEAAQAGVQLAVLPETFVPLYPSNAWAKGAAAFGGWIWSAWTIGSLATCCRGC